MRTQYYQVTGRGPWAIDYPGGETKAHRPGQIVGPVSPANKSVVRGLRTGRLRKLSEREANSLRAYAKATVAVAAEKKAAGPAQDIPVVIVDDPPAPKQ